MTALSLTGPEARGVRAWLARQELGILAAMGVVAAGLLAFAVVIDEVAEGDTRAFDERVLLMLRHPSDLSDLLGPPWLEEMMRDFTAFGSTGVLALFTLAVVGFLVLTGKRHAAALVTVAVVTGVLLSQALKWGFARPRPELVPRGPVYGQSFPSGHAMVSAVVYLTLAALLARTQARRGAGLYFLVVSVVVTVLVKISRVYLSVHWPTDVLAGWAFLCWLVMVWLQQRQSRTGYGPGRRAGAHADPAAPKPEAEGLAQLAHAYVALAATRPVA